MAARWLQGSSLHDSRSLTHQTEFICREKNTKEGTDNSDNSIYGRESYSNRFFSYPLSEFGSQELYVKSPYSVTGIV